MLRCSTTDPCFKHQHHQHRRLADSEVKASPKQAHGALPGSPSIHFTKGVWWQSVTNQHGNLFSFFIFCWAHLNRKLASAEWFFISKAASSSRGLLQRGAVCKRPFSWERSVCCSVPATLSEALLPHSLSRGENVCERTRVWVALTCGYRKVRREAR